MLTFPERQPGTAKQILWATQVEQFDTGGVQVHEPAVEVEELHAVAAAFNQMTAEVLEGRLRHWSHRPHGEEALTASLSAAIRVASSNGLCSVGASGAGASPRKRSPSPVMKMTGSIWPAEVHAVAKLETVQPREADVDNEAIGLGTGQGELLGGCEQRYLVAQRAQEAIDRGAHVGIVIDNREFHAVGLSPRPPISTVD